MLSFKCCNAGSVIFGTFKNGIFHSEYSKLSADMFILELAIFFINDNKVNGSIKLLKHYIIFFANIDIGTKVFNH